MNRHPFRKKHQVEVQTIDPCLLNLTDTLNETIKKNKSITYRINDRHSRQHTVNGYEFIKVNTLNLVQNFNYMDPCDITYQLNEMMKPRICIKPQSTERIHKKSNSRFRIVNRNSILETTKYFPII